MNLNQGNIKYSYYSSFTTEMFLGAKELLKSMPAFYNKIYFSSKFANALWSGEQDEMFENVTLLTPSENINTLRQIIKNNFLYIGDWDSIKFVDKGDYGFSFIGGNIKYIVMPFDEVEDGYLIRSYEVETYLCHETNFVVDKSFFLDTSVNERGEIVRTADFNWENMNEQNTTTKKAEKKAGPQLVTYTGNRGYALVNTISIILISLLAIMTVYVSYYVISSQLFG